MDDGATVVGTAVVGVGVKDVTCGAIGKVAHPAGCTFPAGGETGATFPYALAFASSIDVHLLRKLTYCFLCSLVVAIGGLVKF